MSVKGDLASLGLGEIIQILSFNRKEGVLTLQNEEESAEILFIDGWIGLLKGGEKGEITPQALQVVQQSEEPEKLLKILAFEELFRLFRWERGHFNFIEGKKSASKPTIHGIEKILFDAGFIPLEMTRHFDEWKSIRSTISHLNEIFIPLFTDPSEVKVEGVPREIVTHIHAQNRIRDIVLHSKRNSIEVCQVLIRLLERGLVRKAEISEKIALVQELLSVKKRERAEAILSSLDLSGIEGIKDKELLQGAGNAFLRLKNTSSASKLFLLLARTFWEEGELPKARGVLEKIEKMDPREMEIRERLLEMHLNIGEESLIIASSKKLAHLYCAQGDFQKAHKLWQQIGERFPGSLDPKIADANLYIAEEKRELCIRVLRNILNTLDKNRERKKYEWILKKILSLDPRNRDLRRMLQAFKRDRKKSLKKRLVPASLGLAFLLVIILAGSPVAAELKARSMLKEAKTLLDRGNLYDSKKILNDILDRYPTSRAIGEARDVLSKVDTILLESVRKSREKRESWIAGKFQEAAGAIDEEDFVKALSIYQLLDREEVETQWQEIILNRIIDVKNRLQNRCQEIHEKLKDLEKGEMKLSLEERFARYSQITERLRPEELESMENLVKGFQNREKMASAASPLVAVCQESFSLFRKAEEKRLSLERLIRKEDVLEETNSLFQAAEDFRREGDLIQAKRCYEKILAGPYKGEPFLAIVRDLHEGIGAILAKAERGKDLLSKGDIESAFPILQELVVQVPNFSQKQEIKLPIYVETHPGEASVSLDGEPLGTTPRPITFSPFSHQKIHLSKEGFSPVEVLLSEIREPRLSKILQRLYSWKKELQGPIEADPVIHEEYLIVGDRKGILYALSSRSGETLWSCQLNSLGGIVSSPWIEGDAAYVSTVDGKVYALLIPERRELWSFQGEGSFYASPVVAEKTLFQGSNSGVLYALDTGTGKTRWTFSTPAPLNGNPVVHQGEIFLGTGNGHLLAIDRETGVQEWSFRAEGAIFSPLQIHRGTLFFGTDGGYFYAMDLESRKLKWSFKEKDAVRSRACVAGGFVFFGSTSQKIYGLDLETGTIQRTFQTQGIVSSSLLTCKDRLYAGCKEGALYVFDIEEGKLLWIFQSGGPIKASPAFRGNSIFLCSGDRCIYSFEETF